MGLDLLELQVRTKKTKANRLRQEGYVPGVIYGKGVSRPIILNRKNLENSVRLLGENAVFNISLEGRSELVRIRELQRDPLTREIIHIDLQCTQEGEKIKAFVPIHFEGKHVLEKKGYIINRQMNKIGIEGLAGTIPAHINVPLSAYDPATISFYVSDVGENFQRIGSHFLNRQIDAEKIDIESY